MTIDKLLSIDDLEVLQNTCRRDVSLNRALAKQLAYTMRENERLLTELHSARTRLVAYGENYSHKDSDDAN